MDFQILIIIACVFLVSLFSLLFINKFFRRKTFEEIVAEKKAMTEKIYGPAKAAKKQARGAKLPSKKELKKEKRQRQQKKSEDNTTEVDDSDAQSENPSIEDVPEEPQQQQAVSNKKSVQPVVHVEFAAPEAEIVDSSDNGSNVGQRRSSADSNNQKTTNKSNKQRKNATNSKGTVGILANKNEQVLVKENLAFPAAEEKPALNHFETKPPKDAVELKKQENIENKKPKDQRKTNKPKKETPPESTGTTLEILSVSKDLKQLEEKPVRTGSPKNQSNKLKQQNKKKNDKDNIALDKINENDTIGVSLLMNLFGRAELNRSEIQILIDYLLNKQQDMPASHSEWSDDIVQKLKKQLEEKEKALQEEQESSIGIQAKLREMRTEINAERAQMNANVKGYIEEIQAKKSELAAMTQEIQNLNDKFTLERQQFQNKLRIEKQASSQEVLVQLQRENERATMLQTELAHKEQAISELKAELVHKDQCVNDLKLLVNASHQGVEDAKQKSNEIINTQVNKIHVLEQKLDEAEVVINKQRYELEKAKTTVGEHESSKVELRNLQNALDSKQSELDMALNELGDKQQEIDTLSLANKELSEEIGGINNSAEEKNKQQNDLQHTLDILQTALDEKDKKISEYETSMKQLTSREDELMKQIQEQKEKNNQQQQNHALLLSQEQQKVVTIKPDPAGNQQKQIRDILERLYPDAVAANAGSALSLSFDQWVEKVLATHVKQSISKNSATTATNTTSTNTTNIPATNSNSSSNHSSHNHNNLNNSEDKKNISDSIINSSSVSTSTTSSSSSGSSDVESASSAADKAEILKLQSQNAQLRANSEELTKLVTKTGNTLLELEARAREQEENWRSIVRSKEEEINLLKHSNGEKQDI
ncbi:interaptin isoform X2 [Eupeodes corollae]|uniref:interaptin isoform X2 n=1 Tax=Eupeodes corollae TaxID=290404 RepID=UPI0024936BF3|nr:interaptin isoform X2 [Eupeodes corollae]